MPFEGSQIAVSINHTIVPRTDVPIEKQIALAEFAYSHMFVGCDDLEIKVFELGVNSADHSEGITR